MLAFFDCFSGISGDMTLGALIDAGVPIDRLRADLALLKVDGFTLSAKTITSHGISGTRVEVELDPNVPQDHRHLSDILALLEGSALPESVRDKSAAIFRRLAEAEARVHGVGVESVHFHEVGAVDAIVDVVGAVCGLEALGVSQVYSSSLPTGSGTIRSAHGLLPVPAPATAALFQMARVPLRPSSIEAELVTPTGAAILATLAEFRQPALVLTGLGYGFGRKELPWANCLRVWIGEPLPEAPPGADRG